MQVDFCFPWRRPGEDRFVFYSSRVIRGHTLLQAFPLSSESKFLDHMTSLETLAVAVLAAHTSDLAVASKHDPILSFTVLGVKLPCWEDTLYPGCLWTARAWVLRGWQGAYHSLQGETDRCPDLSNKGSAHFNSWSSPRLQLFAPWLSWTF